MQCSYFPKVITITHAFISFGRQFHVDICISQRVEVHEMPFQVTFQLMQSQQHCELIGALLSCPLLFTITFYPNLLTIFRPNLRSVK